MNPHPTPRRRPRPKVVSLTEAAAERVREIMAKAEKPYAGLRVGVKNGGCAGQEYVLEYAAAADPLDEVVEDKGVTILIEPKAVLFLVGSEIDYETSRCRPSSCSTTERDRRLRLRRERHHPAGQPAESLTAAAAATAGAVVTRLRPLRLEA